MNHTLTVTVWELVAARARLEAERAARLLGWGSRRLTRRQRRRLEAESRGSP
jgi:hypothetical protein